MELIRALAVLAEPPTPAHAGVAAAVGLPPPPEPSGHADVFLFQLHPYGSVHLGLEGMLGGEARARIAGFWRAVGRTPPAEPDHLAALLGLYAALLEEASELERGAGDPEKASTTLVSRAAAALLHEHLLPWLLPFLDRVRELGAPHHRAWAELLGQVLVSQAAVAGRPDAPARHLLEAPPLPDPRMEGGDGFISGLLAPARSGIVLTRHDLAVVARSLELGLRAGERRYALEHLLGLEPGGVLEALSDLAAARVRAHARWPDTVAGVRAFWVGRARTTARLLGELAADGVEADASAASARAEGGVA